MVSLITNNYFTSMFKPFDNADILYNNMNIEEIEMKNDLISIIVPIYNVEKYLNKCIESLVNQTYSNLEIILVDDGSPDNCPEICDRWSNLDDRIKVFHKSNGGQGSARNLGLDNEKGDYVCFVDSDDWIELNYIERLYNTIVKNNADISICNMQEFDEDYTPLQQTSLSNIPQILIYENEDVFKQAYIKQNLFGAGPCNKLYKRKIFETLRFPETRMFEDSAIYLDIFNLANKVVLLPDYLYNYLIRKDSTMRKPLSQHFLEGIFYQNEVRLNFLKTHNYSQFLKDEIIRCIHLCFCQYRRTNDKLLKKLIKSKYKEYKNNYKNILNIFNAPIKVKIKMLYLSLF